MFIKVCYYGYQIKRCGCVGHVDSYGDQYGCFGIDWADCSKLCLQNVYYNHYLSLQSDGEDDCTADSVTCPEKRMKLSPQDESQDTLTPG